MGRVERKEQEKKERKHPVYRYFMIICILIIIFYGIMIVDEAVRSMLMTEEPRAFGYTKINADVHQIYFCGQKVLIDERKVRTQYSQWRNDVQVLWQQFKELTEQFVMNNL